MALQTSLETKLSDIANNMTTALKALSERVAICEERCKEPVNVSKRRHEDPEMKVVLMRGRNVED